MRLNDEIVQRTALEFFGRLPEQLKPDPSQEPFTLVFPPEKSRVQPITVSFGGSGFAVTLHGQEFLSGDRELRRTNIAAKYKFVKTAEGYRAVRQGELQMYGFDQKPGDKLSARQSGIKNVVQRRFAKIFQPDIKLQGFKFAAASWPRPDSSCHRKSSRRTDGSRSVTAERSKLPAFRRA